MAALNPANRKLLHNLVGLFAFDLVARHGNLTGAAEDLGLSQSALSQRIKKLEIELGVALFKREHRGVSLTSEGVRLFTVVRPAIQQMGGAVGSLLDRKLKPRVRISADFAFSTFWLLPNLSQLRLELGDEIELQMLASTAPPESSDDCDINIHVRPFDRMADGDVLLLEENVAAVCSPAFLQAHGPFASPAQLYDAPLLSLSRPPSAEWQTWQGWFESLGVTGTRSRNYSSFNNYNMVIQAALSGHGVALGWLGMIDQLIHDGQLVRATDDVVTSAAGYVMSRADRVISNGPDRVFDWIVDHIKQ